MAAPRSITTLALATGLLLAACGSTSTESGASSAARPAPTTSGTAADTGSTTSEEPPMTPAPDDPSSTSPGAFGLPLGPVPEQVVSQDTVQAAVMNAAERAGVPPADVEVAGYADVTWPDGSLGCPQKGMMYTMALVPGHQLVLQAGGAYLSYHAAEGGDFAYCADPRPPAPASAGDSRR